MAAAARRPGTIDSRIAVRTPTAATRPIASNGPTIAPRLSIARSNPYARPYTAAGTASARSALREGTRRPRAAHAPTRRRPTCHTAVAAPTAADSTAVVV